MVAQTPFFTVVGQASGAWTFEGEVAVDFDRDGDLDVFGMYFNPLGGTFGYAVNTNGVFSEVLPSEVPITPELPFFGRGYLFHDWDGDGDLDLLTSQTYLENVGGFLSIVDPEDPTNPFGTTGINAPFLSRVMSYLVDFDGDGDLDAFQGSRYFAFEDGRYVEKTGTDSPTDGLEAFIVGEQGYVLNFVDFDGDGDLDIFGATYNDTGSYIPTYYENVDGKLVQTPETEGPLGQLNRALTANYAQFVDFDGDGDLDAFSQQTYYVNDNGVLRAANDAENPMARINGYVSEHIRFFDYDGDGDLDWFGWDGWDNPIPMLYRNDNGVFNAIEAPDATFLGRTILAVQDVDGDGDLDIISDLDGLTFHINEAPPPMVVTPNANTGGNDIVLNTPDGLTEAAGSDGIDTVTYEGPGTVTLPDNIENIQLTGDSDTNATGNAANNTMTGNDGNNTLYAQDGDDTVDGGAGNDVLIAGSGNGDDWYNGGLDDDTIVFSSTTAGVDVNLTTGFAVGPEIGTDRLFNIENVVGGSGNDTITGDDGDNLLTGGGGDDIIDGRGGTDTAVYSGAKDDYQVVVGPNGVLRITDLRANADGSDTVSNVEYFQFTDGIFSAADITPPRQEEPPPNEEEPPPSGEEPPPQPGGPPPQQEEPPVPNKPIAGDDGDDQLPGTAGDDIIYAKGGNDRVYAGAGDDTVYAGAGDDQAFGGEGNDVVYGGEGNDIVGGGAGDDTIGGGRGNDQVWGGAGRDTAYGGEGNDTVGGGAGDDSLYGGLGDDLLYGGAGSDVLYGGAGNDTIYGGPGDDEIWGGAGDDQLWGGSGADTFGFVIGSGDDLIFNFDASEGDRLDLQGQSYTVDHDAAGDVVLALSGGGEVTLVGIKALPTAFDWLV